MARKPRDTRKSSPLWRIFLPLAGIIFAIISFIQLSNLLQGEENIFLVKRIQQEIVSTEQSIEEIEQKNTFAKKRIQLLKNNPHIIEEEARRRLYLVKEGETLFMFPKQE